MSCQISILLAAVLWLGTAATPTGDHTCTGVIKHPVTVLVNVTEPVTFRSYTWCLRVPPRCSKYTVQLKDRVKLHTEMHNKTITVCCRGYVEMDNKCVPACPEEADCPFMKCNRTNHCHCIPGYNGLYCNDPCPRGLWGKDCKRPCDCPTGYTCHHLTGDCFVDDRPPRRTTTPITTTTKTRPTTTTAPTTEGTTMETVKTPVFRFPPPPWVDSSSAGKKTTTRQVKAEESPTKIELEMVDATPQEVATRSTPMIEKVTNIEKSPILEFLPATVGTQTAKPTSKKTEVITATDKVSPPVIVSSQSQEVTTSFTTPNTSKPKLLFDTALEDINIHTSPTVTHPRTKAKSSPEVLIKSTPLIATAQTVPQSSKINTKPSIETKMEATPTVVIGTTVHSDISDIQSEPTTQYIFRTSHVTPAETKPVKITLENEAHEKYFDSMTKSHMNNTTTAILTNINNSPLTIKPTSQTDLFTTSVFDQTEPSLNNVGNHKISATTNVELHIATLHTAIPTQLNEAFRTEVTIAPGKKTDEIKLTEEEIYMKTTPNHYTTEKVIVAEGTPTNALSQKNNASTTHLLTIPQTKTSTVAVINATQTITAVDSSSEISLPITIASTTASTITQTFATSMETTKTTTVKTSPSTSFFLETKPVPVLTEVEPPSNDLITTTSKVFATFTPVNTIPSTAEMNIHEIAASTNNPEVITSSSAPQTSTNSTLTTIPIPRVFSTNNSPKITTLKPVVLTDLPATEPTKMQLPAIIEEVFKELNLNKKTKLEEISTSNAAPDKLKKKHEKTKSKNGNVKESFSNQQTKIEKYETLLPTTELTFKSLLHAESNRNKNFSTDSHFAISRQPVDLIETKQVTEETSAGGIENIKPQTPSSPNQLWHPFKKQTNTSEMDLKEQEGQLRTLGEPSTITQPITEGTETNKVMESNTIDYHQNSEEPLRKVLTKKEETNYSLIFNKIKFNMTDSVAEGVKASRQPPYSYLHTPMILVLGIALVTLLLLALTLWVYLKRRRDRQVPFPPCIMAYDLQEPPPLDFDNFDHPLFCPTFINNYGERINKELREMSYDHPRRSQPEPLYAEICH